MRLPTQKRSIWRQMRLQHQGETVFAAEIEWAVRVKSAQRIGDQFSIINFHGTDYVRTGADHQLRAGVHCGMSELAQVSAVFAQKRLIAWSHMLVAGALGAAMK